MKKKILEFFCPLCSAKRELNTSNKLSVFNYFQIIVISSTINYFLYPYVGAKIFISIFIVWALYETVSKINYREKLPCPHCGFDATWYKKDIKVARKKIESFWAERGKNNKGELDFNESKIQNLEEDTQEAT